MIPIKLEIEGLYSYRETQCIHFEHLTAAGLFGIFGAVGSGKSSILEAILLALYGSTERLSERMEKNSMINLQHTQVLIRFEFRSGKNNSQTYLARYEAKRSKKDPDSIASTSHTFYLKSGEDWQPIEAPAEEIVGMKKEHFKQTVIIPQGKFREFIDLTPAPRAKMMKELFGLERFDLAAKTGTLLRAVKDEKIRLNTKIQGLEDISEGLLNQEQDSQAQLRKAWEKNANRTKKLEKTLQIQTTHREKHQSLKKFLDNRSELLLRKPQIDEKRQIHQDFINAKTHLRPIWYQLQGLRADAEKYRVSIVDCERFAQHYEQEIEKLRNEEIQLKKKNQQRPQREGKIRDLKKVVEIRELDEKLIQTEAALAVKLPAIQAIQSQRSSLEKERTLLETTLQKLPSSDANLLAQLKNKHSSWEELNAQLNQKQRMIGQFEQELEKIRDSLGKLHQAIPAEFTTLDKWHATQLQKINQVEQEREACLRTAGFHHHAQHLEAGKPCPLCGAIEHPSPLQQATQDSLLKDLENKLAAGKIQLEKILLIREQGKEQRIHQENHQENLQRNRLEKDKLSVKLEQLKAELSAEKIQDPEMLKQRILEIERQNQDREKIDSSINQTRQKLDHCLKELDRSQNEVQQAQVTKERLTATLLSKKEEIHDPAFCEAFYSKELSDIQSTIKSVEADITLALEALESKQKYLQEIQTKATINQTDLKNSRQSLAEVLEKIKTLETTFDSLKAAHGFEDEKALIELFEQSLDAEKTAKEIQLFDQQLALTESRIEELEQQKDVREFDEAQYQQAQKDTIETRKQAEESQHQLLLLEERLKIMKSKLSEKEGLLEELKAVEKRESYLLELEKLFKGSGFVKYVSTIYLKELCHTANERFMKLSKNSLSLEIDGDNTFWVIDYLNGGKRRLLKTLSGGQTFQASLCLALALAEKVKALNQADQSFFFLDEGFGALDRASLRVVFETLKSLRHENRIVGIISHVEELQQEIGVFAKVELDPEVGSQVSYSF